MIIAPTEIVFTRDALLMLRQALLNQLDVYERLLGISPRTSELRKEAKFVIQSDKKEEKPC